MKICSQDNCPNKAVSRGMCSKHYSKFYSNKEATRIRVRGFKLRNAEHIRKAKDLPCVDCGNSYPYYVMQFDHVRGDKKFELANYGAYSLKTIDIEISKCDLVCSNCHAQRTHKQQTVHRKKIL